MTSIGLSLVHVYHKSTIIFIQILVIFKFISVLYGLECYSGFTLIRGQTVGTDKQTCGKESDRCYNMSVEVTSLSKVKLAGRITVRDNGITQCHSSLRLFNISMHGEYKIITY